MLHTNIFLFGTILLLCMEDVIAVAINLLRGSITFIYIYVVRHTTYFYVLPLYNLLSGISLFTMTHNVLLITTINTLFHNIENGVCVTLNYKYYFYDH
jgi:hypothetical protein